MVLQCDDCRLRAKENGNSMDFESPDVMKDFPGLYASDLSKKGNNDSDYSDETDKAAKKDLLGKRKDKKDKKDKERGYAALEGESSAEEDTRSPSKSKKTKAFKFSTKSKEKREKSREKEVLDKKKDKEKKSDKKNDKEKVKSDKKERKIKSAEEHGDIAEGLPIFGATLDDAVHRSRCHDGVDIPLPVRACIDHIEASGLHVEGLYKVSGAKSKVLHLRKLYNQREHVDLAEYEIPTVTSLLKMYLRDLPEPIFTSDSLIRFEEAGAILNVGTREKHLKTLTENLPRNNRLLLSWILIHFDNVILNERLNKVNMQQLVAALSPTLHTSHKLLSALIHHCRVLFPTVILESYIPPLTSSAKLPEDLENLELELRKQESLLSQIHSEMHYGFISKLREELLWEVQRITTQLKRKIKNLQKDKEPHLEKSDDIPSTSTNEAKISPEMKPAVEIPQPPEVEQDRATDNSESSQSNPASESNIVMNGNVTQDERVPVDGRATLENVERPLGDHAIAFLRLKKSALQELKGYLEQSIESELNEMTALDKQLDVKLPVPICRESNNLEQVMDLLQKENQILQIKKINLVRQIMEQQEICIDLKAKLTLLEK